jgi:hypothetical protein
VIANPFILDFLFTEIIPRIKGMELKISHPDQVSPFHASIPSTVVPATTINNDKSPITKEMIGNVNDSFWMPCSA